MDAARNHSLGEIPLLGEIKLEKNISTQVSLGINHWLTQVSAAHSPEIDI